jgi:hypothetical protein
MNWTIHRNDFGRLVLVDAQGTNHVGVVPVRAFPLAAPTQGLSLVGPDGHELAWVDSLEDLPNQTRVLIEEELAPREFVPAIQRLLAVSSFATPSIWSVVTDRGQFDFVLKAEEDIRRLEGGALLISSSEGLQLRVTDRFGLDRASRKLLERFL